MISQRWFLLVLLTLGCRELAGDRPPVVFLTSVLAAGGVSLGFGLLFKACALRLLAGNALPTVWSVAVLERLQRLRFRLEIVWLLGLPAALIATGWGPWLNSLQAAGMPQSLALLGWFTPSLLWIVLVELTSAQFEELCRHDTCEHFGMGCDCAASAQPKVSWAHLWALRLRLGEMAGLLACLSPLFLIAVLTDVAGLWLDASAAPVVMVCTLLALGLVVLSLPHLLGRWMGAERLPQGHLRTRVEEAFEKLGVRGVEPMLVSSQGRWAGAAVVGWLPQFRRLWLGDALLERLTDQEVDMVVMHELAHVRRGHFLWRALPVVWALASVAVIWMFWQIGMIQSALGTEFARNLIAAMVAGVTLLVGIGRMARVCELDADREACQLATAACPWTQGSAQQAAEILSSALAVLLADCPAARQATWLHPSLSERLLNIRNIPSKA